MEEMDVVRITSIKLTPYVVGDEVIILNKVDSTQWRALSLRTNSIMYLGEAQGEVIGQFRPVYSVKEEADRRSVFST